MKRSFGRTAVFGSALWLALSALGALAYLTDNAIHLPLNYLAFQPPAIGGSYTDSVFGTSIKRITNAPATPDNANGGFLTFITNEYSTMSPFNVNDSRMLLLHESYFALYDGNGTYIADLPFEVYASTEPRWSRSDPNTLYFINGNQLKRMNVSTMISSVVHTFSEYASVRGNGESDICFDGNHFVLAGDGRYVFVYEISTNSKGPVFDTAGHGFDSLYITPNDNVTITWNQSGSARFNGIEMFDRNMAFQRQLTRAGGHMDVTRDVDGSEALLWINSADPLPIPNCQNGIVKVRLSDANQTCLIQFAWGVAVHVSAPDNNGWFFMETYAPNDPIPPTGWIPYTNEILQIKLDGSEVRRLLHHRSRPFNSYYYAPRAAASRDGSKLVFSSNYGLQGILGYATDYGDVYLVNVASGPLPSPSPSPTPTPTPTPSPSPSPSPNPVVRYEQTSPQAVYTGTWVTNKMRVHSSGSAVLAMNAGSRVTFSFTGIGVKWIGYCDQWAGIAKVYVDGALRATVDTYAAAAQAQAVLFSASGLTAGAHTLAVEATGTKNPASGGAWVWVDAFDVTTAPAPPPAWTRREQTDSSVVLTGVWSPNSLPVHSGGSAVLSMAQNDTARFLFTGTGVRWIGYKDQWSGIAWVFIDGVLAGTIDTFAPSQQAQAVLFTSTTLAPGSHTFAVRVSGTKNAASQGYWVWVDAFDYR